MELTVVMPCLNEAETVATCVTKAVKFIADSGITGEVVVADNGSTDGSQRLAEEAGARVVQVKDKGYGNALMGGIVAARGEYVIMGDADDSYDFSNLMPFLTELRDGADLVMGNRFKGGIAPGAMPPLHRYLGNPVLSFVGRLFFRSPIGDFHCGLRGFRRDSALRLGPAGDRHGVRQRDGREGHPREPEITEVPTTLAKDGRSRPPHLRSWRDGWRHLRFLLLFSPRWLFFAAGPGLVRRRPRDRRRHRGRPAQGWRRHVRRGHPGGGERDGRDRLPGCAFLAVHPGIRGFGGLPSRGAEGAAPARQPVPRARPAGSAPRSAWRALSALSSR